MGENRFIIGFLLGVIGNRSCPIKLELKVVGGDKRKLVNDWQTTGPEKHNTPSQEDESNEQSRIALDDDTGEWIMFDKPWLFFG